MVKFERYYIKSRDYSMSDAEASAHGIKRVYNYTSDLDYMDQGRLQEWSSGLYNAGKGEAVLIESALRYVAGGQVYVMSCIVFYTIEQCNMYYIRNMDQFKVTDGFYHLLN